jgi:hypothetical protein
MILLSKNMEDLPRFNSITDLGLCTTYNGNSLSNTIKGGNERIQDFKEVLQDENLNVQKAVKITGIGNKHKKEMWINVKDTNPFKENARRAFASINQFNEYVSVRQVVTDT